ncbi:LysE family translocator [Noviherbaspirillum galbum]|uniref:LysE family translocator n=1 Tax=Noviherbaspirillum galbum TaxID=2709383 RepID=A0A6B3SV79_9BURK|nr:LysE family translocator [Noviherbaspirillum galbum]NEX64637.1 LysE family translocator [Noviherbaspirillum galbum]
MISFTTLCLFLIAVLALQLSPGPNMAFVVSHAAAHGTRAGMAAGAGIAAADLLHTLFTVTGISALVAAWPPSFDLIRYAGAAYLVWLAIKAIVPQAKAASALRAPVPVPAARIFRMAMLNCLLNPKALLFFMIFLPQFVDAGRGKVSLQLAIFGGIVAVVALLFNGILALCSGMAAGLLKRASGSRVPGIGLAAVMLGLALRLVFLDRPQAA